MERAVAWGYVTSDIGFGKEVLIATRHHKDDPQRVGQLVIPGGGLEEGEDYTTAAIREVYQETGIVAEPSLPDFNFRNRYVVKHNLIGCVDQEGNIHLSYLDSGKNYMGRLISLSPRDVRQEPVENPDSDARNPRYVLLSEAFQNIKEFTPACQVLLDLIQEYKMPFATMG